LNREREEQYRAFNQTVAAKHKILTAKEFEEMPRHERNLMLEKMMVGNSLVVFPERR
jgi:hypothetical protein